MNAPLKRQVLLPIETLGGINLAVEHLSKIVVGLERRNQRATGVSVTETVCVARVLSGAGPPA